jgi:hypothetical protein
MTTLMETERKAGFPVVQATLMETFGLGRAASLTVILLTCLITVFAVFWFFHSAPPGTIVVTTGPEGSVFQRTAEAYRTILARNGVKLRILRSQGSLENLKRLVDRSSRVDIGFVQGGIAGGMNIDSVVSLGSISYEPLLVFYRSAQPMGLLSELKGKRLAIGPVGSGTRSLALALLAANGIESGDATMLMDLGAEDAARALVEARVDAVFLMGDFASPQTMRSLLLTPGIGMFNFAQADGYTRRMTYLNKLELPRGSIDLGKDIPDHDVYLIGPTVELIARSDLHPALSDLLLEAATEVHGKAGILKRQGEFPAPLEHEFRISADASRFYKSGKGYLYRSLPFWMASLVNRILVAFGPMVLLLFPLMRMIPALYGLRVRLRIYRWYRMLLITEQELKENLTSEKREELLERLNDIETQVNNMKVPASFGEQFYVLRQHITFVRSRLMTPKGP